MNLLTESYEVQPELVSKLEEELSNFSLIESNLGERKQYLMPQGNLVIQLRQKPGEMRAFFDVKRTTPYVPKYIRKIISIFCTSDEPYIRSTVSSKPNLDDLVP